MTRTPLRPCPHRETIPGPDATAEDLTAWTTAYATEICLACVSSQAPEPTLPPELESPLPSEARAALLIDSRRAALRAQRVLDTLGIGDELLPAVAHLLACQPGTSPYWKRWWATWRGGALIAAYQASTARPSSPPSSPAPGPPR
jgi:hypothetical protein